MALVVPFGDLGPLVGRAKGGMNTRLHAVTNANGRLLSLFMTAGRLYYTGAAALLDEKLSSYGAAGGMRITVESLSPVPALG